MRIKDIVRLLILNESQNEAEELTKLFRNSGYPTRTHRLGSRGELEQLLEEDTWDLLISDDSHAEFRLADAVATIAEKKADVPVLLSTSNSDQSMAEAIEAGVQDMVAKNDDKHLLHASLREISNRRARLDNNSIKGVLEELQARYELLMGGSQDAIAYITDGMHVDVNDAYAAQFGYSDADDMACMPVVDLIAPRDQDKFKGFLRDYSQTGESNTRLEIHGHQEDGEEIPLNMIFSPASYEGEECTQIVIRSGESAASTSGGGQDFREGFADLAQQLVQLKNKQVEASLVYLQVKNLLELRQAVGILSADSIQAQLRELIAGNCADALLVSQVTLDGYILLLPEGDTRTAKPAIDQLRATVHQHIFEIDGITTHCETVAAVMTINHKAAEPAERLVNLLYTGIADLLQQQGEPETMVYTPPATPIKLGSKDLDLDELHEEDRLHLMYQPIVSLRGDPGEYYEVTASLTETDGSPLDVSQLAAGMLDDREGSLFDRWVIFCATKLLAQKRTAGSGDTRLLIKLSPSALRDAEMVNWLGMSLNAAGLPAESLAFQISAVEAETALKLTERLFTGLKKLGCNTCLDAIDTARDREKLLEHVAPSIVKVSEKAVIDAQKDEKGRHTLKQVLNDSSQAEAGTIVPNVCSAATLATLWQLGAAFIQGPYLQDPAPIMEYEFAEIA